MAYKLNEIDLVHVDKKKWKHIMTEYKKNSNATCFECIIPQIHKITKWIINNLLQNNELRV